MRYFAPLLFLIAVSTSACTIQYGGGPGAPMLPAGSTPIRPVVARGYAAYGARLSTWGTWHPDEEHGALWCPRPEAGGGPAFQPYVSRGRWGISTAPIGHAPEGSPVWESEDRDTWGEITTHHGWWIPVGGHTGWCWVPGDDETPASVVWRSGDGFVGWAAEPPEWAACDPRDADDLLDWAFTLLGTLCEGSPDQNQLTGDAERQARAATSSRSASHGASRGGAPKPQRVGPSGSSIAAARGVLADYVAAHPSAVAAASSKAGSSGSAASNASPRSSAASQKSKSSDEKLAAFETMPPPLPYAMDYYNAFRAEPPVGPAGLVPGTRAGGSSAGSPRGDGVGSSSAALSGASPHSSAAALHAATQTHGVTPPASGYSASSHGSSSYSSSSHGSSSHSSSSHSSSSRGRR